MYIQSKVLHCEHVFVLIFYYLYYKIKALLMLICMQFVVQCFNCLLIQSRIFLSTNKIRCVHDFGRKSLETCLFPFHQKKEYLYINYLFFSKIHLPYLRHLSVSVRYMMKEQDILSYKLTSLFIYSFFQADFFYSVLCKYSLFKVFFSHIQQFSYKQFLKPAFL